MKHFLLFIALFTSIIAIAQKTDKTKIDFEVEMLPLEIISKEKLFSVFVDYEYRSKTEAANQEIASQKEQAAKDKEAYDKKNYGEKLLATKVLGEAKPTGYYNSKSFVPTLFPEEIVKEQINIPGYKRAADAKGSVKIVFSELSYSLDQTKTKINYSPLKVTLSITNDKGAVVFEGILPNNSSTLSTTAAATPADLEKSMLSTLRGAETNAKNVAIANVNNYLKINYGYNLLKNDRSFFDVKDKKQSYPEYHEAIEKVKNAFMYTNIPAKQDIVTSKLKEAIAIWEKSLTEMDKTNKEARINADIAAATYLNLAEACIWIKEFDKAFEHLANHKALNQDYSRTYKDASDFLKDYSTRYNKFTQY